MKHGIPDVSGILGRSDRVIAMASNFGPRPFNTAAGGYQRPSASDGKKNSLTTQLRESIPEANADSVT